MFLNWEKSNLKIKPNSDHKSNHEQNENDKKAPKPSLKDNTPPKKKEVCSATILHCYF